MWPGCVIGSPSHGRCSRPPDHSGERDDQRLVVEHGVDDVRAELPCELLLRRVPDDRRDLDIGMQRAQDRDRARAECTRAPHERASTRAAGGCG